jgi:hypothetical protein
VLQRSDQIDATKPHTGCRASPPIRRSILPKRGGCR